jgi:hypothetical protein
LFRLPIDLCIPEFFAFMKTNFLGEMTWQMHKIRGKIFGILIKKVEQNGIRGR